MKIRIEFKWCDMWIGLFHKKKLVITTGDMIWGVPLRYEIIKTWEQHIWICTVPCLPIHIWWEINPEEGRRGVIA